MKNKTIGMCILALLLGMLVAYMLKGLCECNLVEGINDSASGVSSEETSASGISSERLCGCDGIVVNECCECGKKNELGCPSNINCCLLDERCCEASQCGEQVIGCTLRRMEDCCEGTINHCLDFDSTCCVGRDFRPHGGAPQKPGTTPPPPPQPALVVIPENLPPKPGGE